jgi:hypothetical protein
MAQTRTRFFCVTNFNLDADYAAIVAKGQIRYIAVGEEVCPTTGRPHHQVWCYFHNALRTGGTALKKIGDMFGPVHAHVLPMRGSMAENDAYCSKEGTFRTYGERPAQGARGDIKEVAATILSGDKTSDDICEIDPEFHHKYGRTLDRLEGIAMRKRWRTEMTQGIWYTGPTGAGKSHKVFDDFSPSTHYVKNLNEEWWDGYKQQEYVILNEFRGQIKFSELLDLVDKWPKTVKWRNRESVPFTSKYVLVASILAPEDVYRRSCQDEEPWGQFERRFKVITLSKRPLERPASPPAKVASITKAFNFL